MTAVAHALEILAQRAQADAALAETVLFLAEGDDGPDDPFADPAPALLSAARSVNERRQHERRGLRTQGLLPTAEVVRLLTSVNDRKGVDRRRKRGQLLGWSIGRTTGHPSWQFDRLGGDTRPGLHRVLTALRTVAPDPQVADALMTAPRDDLAGLSLAELFAEGEVDTVVRLVVAAGDQS